MFASRLCRLHLKRRCRTYSQSPAFKNDVLEKIVYNSVLQKTKTGRYWKNVNENNKKQKLIGLKQDIEPVSLQYLNEYIEQDAVETPKVVEELKEIPLVLPYSIVNRITINEDEKKIKNCENNEIDYDSKYNNNLL